MLKMIAIAMLVCMAATAYAEPPPMKLNHQGRLLDAAMTPASGSHVMRFSIYSAPTGGTPLWTEPQSLTFDDGYYATTLGALTPIAREVFGGSTMYLAITVDNDAEMTPREPIDSVPYAFVSTNAVGDITPRSISVNGNPIVDATGRWVGSPTGLAGPAGPQGAQGPAGPTGATGATGANGAMGATGAIGATGATGAMGATGAIGPQGPTGPSGPQGPAGSTGPQGPQGPAGFHSCVVRYASVGVACSSGEMITGGGCVSGATGGTIKSSYPAPAVNGATPTSWQCDGIGPLTAYAVCCK